MFHVKQLKALEYTGAFFAVSGALLLALNYGVAGYSLFIVSGLLLIPQAKLCNLNGLLVMQSVFLFINIIGIYNRLWLN